MADKTQKQINDDNNLSNPSGNEVVTAYDPDSPSASVGIVVSALPISTATQTALDAKQASLVSGTNIKTINSTSLLGSGNIALGGAVDSVNTQTGVVVIDADDIADAATTNKFVTASDITKLSNTSGTNTGDQDISGIATNASAITDIETKTDNIAVTQAVNLDTMESNIATNNSKTTNATHTGEVTGSGALTIAGDVVDEANLKVSNDPTNGYSLVARSGNTGGMTWEDISGGGGGTVDVLSNVATDKIIGRTTAGSGDSEELSPSATRTLLNVEDGATADQTGAQIKSAYEAESNAYTDTKNTKLSGIEASADVTDTANVTSAGALMDSEVTNLAEVKAFDASDYATALGADDNYVTDAEKTVIGNTSGTNSGDQDLSTLAPIANPTFTGEIGIGSVNVSETELGILEGAALTTTELNYVDGVTSSIQTQIDAAGAPEGTAVKSTGEGGGSKFLREDGDGTSSWQAIGGGGNALTSNPLSQFAATTSAQLAGVISNETGSGLVVFNNSPTLVTPALGTPASGVATNLTGTASGLTVGATTGVEAGADVTDATNVTSAGALMDSEVTNLAQVKAFSSADYAVALGADDNYVTDAEKTVVGNTSGTNTGDNAVNTLYSGLVTNATHTGDVTGDTALTIANNAVTPAKMQGTSPTSAKYYRGDGTWNTPTNTTYSEISDAEINTGTASTSRAMSGRRATTIVTRARDGRVPSTDGARLDTITDANYLNSNTTKSQVGLGNVDNTSDATKQTAFLQVAYPVGAVYMSGVSTSPATLFGFGTWTRIQGKFVVGVSDSDADFDLNDTGGVKDVTLTEAQMPSHSHDVGDTANNRRIQSNSGGDAVFGIFDFAGENSRPSTESGSDNSHENLPPYIAKYLWERTA